MNMSMNETDVELRRRVDESLKRLNYAEARFVGVEDRTVWLKCPVSDRNDRFIMTVAIRLLPGVSAVEFVSNPGTS